MGTPLTSATVSSTYQALLKVGNNTAISSSMKRLSDGLGNDMPLFISNNSLANYGLAINSNNTAFGEQALINTIGADWSTAFGFQALKTLTSGSANSAFGNGAGALMTTSSNNTLVGYASGGEITTGDGGNTAIGSVALAFATTEVDNTAIGNAALAQGAGLTGNYNSALGAGTGSSGFSGSVILGVNATATANNQFVVGSSGTNSGAVTTETISPNRTWTVRINGANYKIPMLAL